MSLKYLINLIALQGGAIVHSSDCTEDEIERARKTGLLAVVDDHVFIYKSKIWMANVKSLLKRQENEQRARESAESQSVFPRRS